MPQQKPGKPEATVKTRVFWTWDHCTEWALNRAGLSGFEQTPLVDMFRGAGCPFLYTDPTGLIQVAKMGNYPLARAPLCTVTLHQLAVGVILSVLMLAALPQEHSLILLQTPQKIFYTTRPFQPQTTWLTLRTTAETHEK